VAQIVNRMTDGKTFPAAVLRQIIEKTDGVPLFVEEMTKAILESGHLKEVDNHYALTGSFSTFAIPATLHDSLIARLDRLVTAKAIAQYAAVLGRQFAYDLLSTVSQLDAATLQRELGRLVEAEIVYQRGVPPQSIYVFKHALIQDAAYQSLLKSTRQHSHQRIAQVLEEQFPETAVTQPELLAHHYTEAGLIGQAIPYWQQAGERAAQRSANVEAISYLTQELELLQTLPEAPERTQQELAVHIALGVPMVQTKGHAAPEVEAIYTRARALCQQLGDTVQLFAVLLGLRRFYFMRGELRTADELGEQLLRLAERLDDAGLLVRAHMMLAEGLFSLGEFARARAHAEEGITRYAPQQHRAQAFRYGNDPGVCCRSFAAMSLWVLGYPDQALQRSEEALEWAQELAHPFSLAFALNYVAYVHQFRREGALTQTRAEATITLATEKGFPHWMAGGAMRYGWALAHQGRAQAGIEQMTQGLMTYRASGTALAQSYWLALLAEAYSAGGQAEAGLTVLAEALTHADNTGECFYEAELHRLKGELRLQQSSDNHPEAESCFHHALDIARTQQAKSLELRAATSLARLWQQQGKRAEAQALLAPIYGWFTEGFDTADLQEAKALLATLA
jgi:predicted ATPase